MCDRPAVCGGRLPGDRKARALCQSHADAVFGPVDPPWRWLDAKTQREIVDEWLRGLTIIAHPDGRTPEELLAEIAEVNQMTVDHISIVSPLLPGEARTLTETTRANSRLRSRETKVHAFVTLLLVDWLAEETGQTRSDVLHRLALRLDAWLSEHDRPDAEDKAE